jgi:hypothetical protein
MTKTILSGVMLLYRLDADTHEDSWVAGEFPV